MFWRKVFLVLAISVLLMGAVVVPTGAEESKSLPKKAIIKQPNATYTVCASGCDFSSIQTAIDTVNAGDTLSLAAETFTESITINKDLTIQGAGEESTIVQAATAPGIATSQVITTTQGINLTLQGLTVRYGVANEGGGIYSRQGSLITLSHVTISDNSSTYGGGGLFFSETNSNLSNVTFRNNTTTSSGGGFSCLGLEGVTTNLTNTVFIDNVARHGGGMSGGCSPTLSNVTFSNNTATGFSENYGNGGGLSSHGTLSLVGVTFFENTATGKGGGLYAGVHGPASISLTNVSFIGNLVTHPHGWGNGGGMHTDRDSNPTLNNVIFSGNSVNGSGGGISNFYYTAPILNRVTFTNNTATADGGGMYNEDSSPILTNVIFSNNTAAENGGGMYSEDFLENQTPMLINVTFSGNSATNEGGGIYNNNFSPDITNSIFWGNTDQTNSSQIFNHPGSPIISFSDIQDSGGSGPGWNNGLGTDGGGNIDTDPLFVDSANNNLHLGEGSPAIDAGDNTALPPEILSDLGGSLRYWDVVSIPDSGNGSPPIIDMGAYEFFDGERLYLPMVIR